MPWDATLILPQRISELFQCIPVPKDGFRMTTKIFLMVVADSCTDPHGRDGEQEAAGFATVTGSGLSLFAVFLENFIEFAAIEDVSSLFNRFDHDIIFLSLIAVLISCMQDVATDLFGDLVHPVLWAT